MLSPIAGLHKELSNLNFLHTKWILNHHHRKVRPTYPGVVCLHGAMPQEQIYEKMVGADIVITTARFLADESPLEMTSPRLDYLRELKLANHGGPLFDLIVFDEAQRTPAITWRAIRSALAGPNTKILFTTSARYRSHRQPLDYDCAAAEFRWVDGLLVRDPCIKDLCFLELQGGTVRALVCSTLFPNSMTVSAAHSLTHSLLPAQDVQRTLQEIATANERGASYELPDGEILLVVDAVARQLGAVRRMQREMPVPHKALIIVDAGVGRAQHVADLVRNSGMHIKLGNHHYNTPMRVEWLARGRSTGPIMSRFHCADLNNVDCLDALVVESTLGESYDFPFVSVVGILRAYQSLPPFYQVAGRAARRIRPTHAGVGASLDCVDNVAHVITHEWLNLRRWFTMLCKLESEHNVPQELDEAVQGVDAAFDAEVDGQELVPAAARGMPRTRQPNPGFVTRAARFLQGLLPGTSSAYPRAAYPRAEVNVARFLLAPSPAFRSTLRGVVQRIHADWCFDITNLGSITIAGSPEPAVVVWTFMDGDFKDKKDKDDRFSFFHSP